MEKYHKDYLFDDFAKATAGALASFFVGIVYTYGIFHTINTDLMQEKIEEAEETLKIAFCDDIKDNNYMFATSDYNPKIKKWWALDMLEHTYGISPNCLPKHLFFVVSANQKNLFSVYLKKDNKEKVLANVYYDSTGQVTKIVSDFKSFNSMINYVLEKNEEDKIISPYLC